MGKTTPKPTLILRLYIAGTAPNSVAAVANIRTLCEGHFANTYELEVVDVLEEPHRAFDDGILVTPTLLKLMPRPKRLIGNLSDTAQVLQSLRADA